MGIPSMSDLAAYEPRWPGVVELKISDQWRARFVDEQDLPPNAPVSYAYAVVYMGDKGYVCRRPGEQQWDTIEGELAEKEQPEGFVKRAAKERMGATIGKLVLIGFLECKATSHNPDYAPGTVTVRPIYLAVAKKVEDLPGESEYERRRLPLNQHFSALRARYPELEDYLGNAAQQYAVMRAKGEV
jgi:hypothetical protein